MTANAKWRGKGCVWFDGAWRVAVSARAQRKALLQLAPLGVARVGAVPFVMMWGAGWVGRGCVCRGGLGLRVGRGGVSVVARLAGLGSSRSGRDAPLLMRAGSWSWELFFSSSFRKSVFLNFDQLYIYKNINIYNT
jgi:hypothetical protein